MRDANQVDQQMEREYLESVSCSVLSDSLQPYEL